MAGAKAPIVQTLHAATAICGKGAKMNQAEYYQAHQVDGELTDRQMSEMLELPEGDSVLATQDGQPPAAVPTADQEPIAGSKKDDAPAPAGDGAGNEPVVMAKDGVNTIPYAQLLEARTAAQQATDRIAALEAELVAAKATPAAAAPAGQAGDGTDPPAGEEGLFGDFSEEQLGAGVRKITGTAMAPLLAKIADLEAQLSAVAKPVQSIVQTNAHTAHFAAIQSVHKDHDAVVASPAFEKWVDAQPSFARDAYKAVVEQGTADQVIEMLNTFKTSTGVPASTSNPSDPAAAAAAAIAKAQSAPPMSLSDIPAGSAAHHDQGDALQQMSGLAAMSAFEGKTTEQINALLAKAHL